MARAVSRRELADGQAVRGDRVCVIDFFVVRQLAAVSKLQRRGLLGANRKLKTSDAVILQDRDIEVRDVRIRHEDQPVIACANPRPRLHRAELQRIETLPGQSHNLKPYIRVVVVMAELPNSFSKGTAEERHVEHVKAIDRFAPGVKRVACIQAAERNRDEVFRSRSR